MSVSELGAYLQRHREERGWSLEEVEALTRIRRRWLEAMEAGDWDNLPPGVYTRGLLRNYAHALGVSVQGVLRMYVKERPREALPAEPQLISRPLTNEPRLSFELVLAGILLVVAVGLIAWVLGTQLPTYLDASADPSATQAAVQAAAAPTATPRATSALPGKRKTAVPAGTSTGQSGEGTAAGTVSADASALPQGSAAPTGGAATGTLVASSTASGPTAAATKGATAATETLASSATAGAPLDPSDDPGQAVAADRLLLQILATSDAWILVTANGEQEFSGFVRKGERRTFRATERLGLRTGNAGGTDVKLNGQAPPAALGERGAVKEFEWRLLPNGEIEQREL
jgi:cytoskeletal protein RodZ